MEPDLFLTFFLLVELLFMIPCSSSLDQKYTELYACQGIDELQEIVKELKILQDVTPANIELIVMTDTQITANCIPFPSNLILQSDDMLDSSSENFNKYFSTNMNEIVLIVAPSNSSDLHSMWNKLHLSERPGYRRWFPTTVFFWPYEIAEAVNAKEILTSEPLSNLTRFTMISDEILFAFRSRDKSWSVWETYRFTFLGTLSGRAEREREIGLEKVAVNLIGLKEDESKFKTSYVAFRPPSKLIRRENLEMTLIKAVAPTDIIKLEANWQLDNKTSTIKFIGGISVRLMNDLRKIMNFSLEIVSGDFSSINPSPDKKVSTYNLSTANLLKYRQVDIFIGHTTPIPGRLEQLDILIPSLYNRLWAYVHEPPPSSIRDIFFAPFHTKLWFALLLTWLLMLVVTKILVSIMSEKFRCIANAESDCFQFDPFLLDAYFWSIATITQQGWERHPTRNPLRIVFVSGSILTIVTYIAYAAAIVSIFSLEEIPIPSLDSLYRSSIPVRVTKESSNVAELAKGLQREGKIKPDAFMSNYVGIPRLFETPMAFIVYDHLLHFGRSFFNISQYEYCTKIKAFPVTKTPQATSMMMPKDSPLREMFNHKIMFLKERGILRRHQLKFHRDGGVQCPKSFNKKTTRSNSILDLNDIFSAVVVAIIGGCLSLILFICEYANYRKLET